MTTLLYHETLIQGRLEEAKKKFIEIIVDEEEPAFEDIITSSVTVSGERDLGRLMGEVSDFARYWLAQGKKIRLKVEGEARDG